jgi:16S rRNA (guanine527-N7)-methyltransferase
VGALVAARGWGARENDRGEGQVGHRGLLKKGALEEELVQGRSAARAVGAVLKADVGVTLPGLTDGRRLLVWKQQKLCPAQYPRSGAVMAKKPLA